MSAAVPAPGLEDPLVIPCAHAHGYEAGTTRLLEMDHGSTDRRLLDLGVLVRTHQTIPRGRRQHVRVRGATWTRAARVSAFSALAGAWAAVGTDLDGHRRGAVWLHVSGVHRELPVPPRL